MRHNAVIDILLIIIFFLSLLICGKVSADTGWQSDGDFQGAVEFGGPSRLMMIHFLPGCGKPMDIPVSATKSVS
nr:hypothetical protein [Escherichia coli]